MSVRQTSIHDFNLLGLYRNATPMSLLHLKDKDDPTVYDRKLQHLRRISNRSLDSGRNLRFLICFNFNCDTDTALPHMLLSVPSTLR